MSKFPLYDSMIKGTPKTDLTIKNKQEFSKLVEQMDKNGYELIYTLIRMYQIENKDIVDTENGKLPYEGILENGNLHFDLEKLPNKLKHLIFKFLTAHIQKMNDDLKKC